MACNFDRPWEIQGFESVDDHGLFQNYLTLPPPRRIRDLECGLSLRAVDDLARSNFWANRAQAWDEHLNQIRIATIERITEETAAQVAKRHARQWRKVSDLAFREVEKIDRISAQNDIPLLPQALVFRTLDKATKNERLSFGQATEIVAETEDLSQYSIEDLETLKEIRGKYERR